MIMNKIQIEKDTILELNNQENEINITKNCNIKFKVFGVCKIKLLIKANVKIEIQLEKKANLLVNQLGINSSIDYLVNLDCESKLFVVDSILSEKDCINHIKLIHNGNNCETKFYTNGINYGNNKMYFNLDGVIPKDLQGTFLEENSKIINCLDGDSKIIPNLIIDTKEVIANHSAFIGTLNKDDIAYLMSRGITKQNAKKLLMKSILLSKMSLNIEDFIEEIVLYLNINKGGD